VRSPAEVADRLLVEKGLGLRHVGRRSGRSRSEWECNGCEFRRGRAVIGAAIQDGGRRRDMAESLELQVGNRVSPPPSHVLALHTLTFGAHAASCTFSPIPPLIYYAVVVFFGCARTAERSVRFEFHGIALVGGAGRCGREGEV
jgi:hypothetical protein